MKVFINCCYLAVAFIVCTHAAQYFRKGPDGRQYLIENDQQFNWYQALHKCQQQNLQLVEINSSEKNAVVTSVIRTIFDDPPNLWLGANDEYNTAKDYQRPFYWSSTGHRMTYFNWSKNNPDNYRNNEHCVHFWKNYPFQWNDNDCTAKMGFICEPNYTDEQKCKDLQKKRQNVNAITANISEDSRQQQWQQNEIIEQSVKDYTLIDQKFNDALESIQKQLLSDIQQILAQSINSTAAAVDARQNSMNERENQTIAAAFKIHKEFQAKFETATRNIDSELLC